MIKKSDFGVFGLGVMGSSISLNIAGKGYGLSVYNRIDEGEENVVGNFMATHNKFDNIKGFNDLKLFIDSLKRPRKILIMINAGPAVDSVLNILIPLLSKGDIIIDGGNSYFMDTKKRFELAHDHGIEFIGAGISGGEEGALKGPSIMPGGTKVSYALVADILESIAAKDDSGKPCCTYIGPEGSGHFIKMVHNGIEYVEMQLLAELYAIMRITMSNEEIAIVFEDWSKGELSSYLLDITVQILRKKDGDDYLLDKILDRAGNKGTGSWSSKVAFDLGIPNTMMAAAVFARYISSFKESRTKMAQLSNQNNQSQPPLEVKAIEKAYESARLINHQQGFKLIKQASEANGWTLNLSDIARIWSNGCIIKSSFINRLEVEFKAKEDIFEIDHARKSLVANEIYLRQLLSLALNHRVSLHCFSAAYHYWTDMTTQKLPANLIQAQRDFFGAHTYQRIDAPESESYHTNW